LPGQRCFISEAADAICQINFDHLIRRSVNGIP
jgi:hypothetical protein